MTTERNLGHMAGPLSIQREGNGDQIMGRLLHNITCQLVVDLRLGKVLDAPTSLPQSCFPSGAGGTWLAQVEKPVTPEVRVVSSNPYLGHQAYFKEKKMELNHLP